MNSQCMLPSARPDQTFHCSKKKNITESQEREHDALRENETEAEREDTIGAKLWSWMNFIAHELLKQQFSPLKIHYCYGVNFVVRFGYNK